MAGPTSIKALLERENARGPFSPYTISPYPSQPPTISSLGRMAARMALGDEAYQFTREAMGMARRDEAEDVVKIPPTFGGAILQRTVVPVLRGLVSERQRFMGGPPHGPMLPVITGEAITSIPSSLFEPLIRSPIRGGIAGGVTRLAEDFTSPGMLALGLPAKALLSLPRIGKAAQVLLGGYMYAASINKSERELQAERENDDEARIAEKTQRLLSAGIGLAAIGNVIRTGALPGIRWLEQKAADKFEVPLDLLIDETGTFRMPNTLTIRKRYIDSMAAIVDFVKLGPIPAFRRNPLVLTRLFAGVAGKEMGVLNRYKEIWLKAKEAGIKYDELFDYMEAQRRVYNFNAADARRALDPEAKPYIAPKSKAEYERLIDDTRADLLSRGGAPLLAEFHNVIGATRDYTQNVLLKLFQESGMISQMQYDNIVKANPFYAPFKVVRDEDDALKSVIRSVSKIPVSQQNVVMKQLGGSTRDVVDIGQEFVVKGMRMVKMAEQNRVIRSFYDLRTDPNYAPYVKDLTDVPSVAWAIATNEVGGFGSAANRNNVIARAGRLFRFSPAQITQLDTDVSRLLPTVTPRTNRIKIDATGISEAPEGFGIVRVFINGVPKKMALPTQVSEALNNMSVVELNGLEKVLAGMTNMLKVGAVALAPAFWARNMPRDIAMAFARSPVGFSGSAYIKGFFHSLFGTKLFQEYLESGAAYSGFFERFRTPEEMIESSLYTYLERLGMRPDIKEKVKFSAEYAGKKLLGAVERAGVVGELASRVGLYERALKAHKELEEAAYIARGSTIDYAVIGSAIRHLNMIIPFLNPRIQATRVGWQALTDNTKYAAMTIGTVMTAQMGSWMHNTTNFRDVYDSISEHEKQGNFILIYGRKYDPETKRYTQVVKIPLGTPVTWFTEPVRRFMDWMAENKPLELGAHMLQFASDQISPIEFAEQGEPDWKRMVAGLGPATRGAIMLGTGTDPWSGRIVRPEHTPEGAWRASRVPWYLRTPADLFNINPLYLTQASEIMLGSVGRSMSSLDVPGETASERWTRRLGGSAVRNVFLGAAAPGTKQEQWEALRKGKETVEEVERDVRMDVSRKLGEYRSKANNDLNAGIQQYLQVDFPQLERDPNKRKQAIALAQIHYILEREKEGKEERVGKLAEDNWRRAVSTLSNAEKVETLFNLLKDKNQQERYRIWEGIRFATVPSTTIRADKSVIVMQHVISQRPAGSNPVYDQLVKRLQDYDRARTGGPP